VWRRNGYPVNNPIDMYGNKVVLLLYFYTFL
jgi:hypothetical protein